jgi:hypothetical protein
LVSAHNMSGDVEDKMDSAQEQRIQYEQRIQRITTNEWILIFVNGYCCCHEVTENMNCITS